MREKLALIKIHITELQESTLNTVFEKYNINTNLRKAHFLAQALHESGYLKNLVENLKYSEMALINTFNYYKKRPNEAKLDQYKEEVIANKVYADKNRKSKLGNVSDGDGYKYRGRGIFQITGYYNQQKVMRELGINDNKLLSTLPYAYYSAGIFWRDRKLNELADKDNGDAISIKINSGTNGIKDRLRLINILKEKVFNS